MGILNYLKSSFALHDDLIAAWFAHQFSLTPPLIYGSVDLRHSGEKIAPVDMNLFPAGFNHLSSQAVIQSISAAQKIIQSLQPKFSKILLIPESHTRNLFYWDSILTLCHILKEAQYSVRIGSADPILFMQQPRSTRGETIQIEPIIHQTLTLQPNEFGQEMILLNNDLSEGIPLILKDLSQPILPLPTLGWHKRRKSTHLHHYTRITTEFSKMLNIDPWLITPLYQECSPINFNHPADIEQIITQAVALLEIIKAKYAEYHIKQDPFLIIKANAGTYGMAVMTVRDPLQLTQLNRKQRTHMAMTKGKNRVSSVIIQEGIHTQDTIGPDHTIAEPVLYLWGETVVGGFYRAHKTRRSDENLNTPGMYFQSFLTHDILSSLSITPHLTHDQFSIYSIIAKLSMLAAANEIYTQ